jgi:hypothetical protein
MRTIFHAGLLLLLVLAIDAINLRHPRDDKKKKDEKAKLKKEDTKKEVPATTEEVPAEAATEQQEEQTAEVVTEQAEPVVEVVSEPEFVPPVAPGPACAALKNHFTHFTVEVGVGSPPQFFDLIPDTGSSNVVVNSCVCRETGHCGPESRCFWGKNSTSFHFKANDDGEAPAVGLSYGSGDVLTVSSCDRVAVGRMSAQMEGGLLLITNQALRIAGTFEGILGLGVPGTADAASREASQMGQEAPDLGHGFLQTSGVSTFSMCYNDAGAPGVIRFGTQQQSDTLGNIGTSHWGLGMQGISIGDGSGKPLSICSYDGMRPGQTTPCGAIPDSGTTVITGPEEALMEILTSACNQWPRCKKLSAFAPEPRFAVFQSLLMECEEWLHEGEGLDELPPLHFDLVGAGGSSKKVTIPATSYILQQAQNKTKVVLEYIDTFPTKVQKSTDEQQRACFPAFDVMDYPTERNGPVWILGMPLFYEYQVGYDKNPEPPALSFSSQPCGACSADGAEVAQLSRANPRRDSAKYRRHHPRQMWGPIRKLNVDRTQPL